MSGNTTNPCRNLLTSNKKPALCRFTLLLEGRQRRAKLHRFDVAIQSAFMARSLVLMEQAFTGQTV